MSNYTRQHYILAEPAIFVERVKVELVDGYGLPSHPNLPSSADLDSVAEEREIKEQTECDNL